MKRLSVMGTAALALVLGMAAAQATPRIHPAQASDLTAARGAAAATPVSGASAGAISVDCVAKKKKKMMEATPVSGASTPVSGASAGAISVSRKTKAKKRS